MQSNSLYNSISHGKAELYQEVFKVLDQLGMADLKLTFQEHCIQDQTLHYVETEDELKQLLREIGIPLGRCIPIMKSWSKRYTNQVGQLVTMPAKVATAEKFSQVSVETTDACVQTDDIVFNTADYNKMLNNMADINLSSQQEILNHYAAQLADADYKLNEARSGSLNSAQVPVPYGTQQVDPYLHVVAQMWPNISQYSEYAANMYAGAFLQAPATSVPTNMVVSDPVVSQTAVMFNHNVGDANHVSRPTVSSHVPTPDVRHHQRMTTNIPSPKDIVDERDDLAIEQSLKDFENMEMESQHSYASALNTETAGLSEDSQHSFSSITDQHSYHTPPTQRVQSTSISQPPPRHALPARTIPLEKPEISHFTKCDDISVESGASRLPSSLQSVGPQTLQGYLDSLPETPEYKQAMQGRNPKKGWKPLDGKHITSGKKVAFKPMFWDNEGRMRHGIRVKGSDKSEECWRHVEGKAPAGCTFAHSRLGDTLQFICVKCTYERSRNDWCSDKTKHKQYIFNIGAYRNLEGGVWKMKTSS